MILYQDIKDPIEINNKFLKFNGKSCDMCFNCGKAVENCKRRNICIYPKHKYLIRNKIFIKLGEEYKIEIINVNEYNYNPSNIILHIKNKRINNYQGLIVSTDWAHKSTIDNQNDLDPLSYESASTISLTRSLK
jgi:hypothetical protein